MFTLATNDTIDFLVTTVTVIIVATFAVMIGEVTSVCYILKKYVNSSVLGLVDHWGRDPQMTNLLQLISL
jgi:hypothetical protein